MDEMNSPNEATPPEGGPSRPGTTGTPARRSAGFVPKWIARRRQEGVRKRAARQAARTKMEQQMDEIRDILWKGPASAPETQRGEENE